MENNRAINQPAIVDSNGGEWSGKEKTKALPKPPPSQRDCGWTPNCASLRSHLRDLTPWGWGQRPWNFTKMIPGPSLKLNKQITITTPGAREEGSYQSCCNMFSSQEKITRHAKKWKYDPYTGQATETACESKQMVEFSEKDFKVAVINLSKKRKEAMIKEAKGWWSWHIK